MSRDSKVASVAGSRVMRAREEGEEVQEERKILIARPLIPRLMGDLTWR